MNPNTNDHFRSILLEKREEKKLSITKLSSLIGISKGYLSNIEKGNSSTPSPSIIKKLSFHLDIDYYKLMELAGYSKEETIDKLFSNQEMDEMEREILLFAVKKYILEVQKIYEDEKINKDIREFIEGYSENLNSNIETYNQLIHSEVINTWSTYEQQTFLRFLWMRIQFLNRQNKLSSNTDTNHDELFIFDNSKKYQQYTQSPSRVHRHEPGKKIIRIPIINSFSAFSPNIDNESITALDYKYKVIDYSNDDNYISHFFIFLIEDNHSYKNFNIQSGYQILFERHENFSNDGIYLVYLRKQKSFNIIKLFKQSDNASFICLFGDDSLPPLTSDYKNIKIIGRATTIEFEVK